MAQETEGRGLELSEVNNVGLTGSRCIQSETGFLGNDTVVLVVTVSRCEKGGASTFVVRRESASGLTVAVSGAAWSRSTFLLTKSLSSSIASPPLKNWSSASLQVGGESQRCDKNKEACAGRWTTENMGV